MTLSMTEAEILGKYRRADKRDKNAQIRIIAQLNGTSEEVIAQYLEDHGEKVDQRFWRYKKKPEPAEKPDQEAKADADKPRLTLVPTQIMFDIAAVREYGTAKYGDPDNWKRVEPERYREALLRHVFRYIDDPEGLDESGLPHLWHVATNVAFLCALEVKK